MLQPVEQRQEVPIAYLVAFTRALIRNNPNPDCITLAALSADTEVPITDEQKESFARAVMGEMNETNWPKGFF